MDISAVGGGQGRGPRIGRWVFLAFGVYALANAFPLSDPRRMARIVPDPWVDPLLYLMYLKWYGTQIFRNPLGLWEIPVYYPVPHAGTFSDIGPVLGLLALPVAQLTGSWTAAYNGLLVLGFWLSAWFTYRLSLRLGAGPVGAVLAGMLYGFASARFHFTPNLKMQWGPLVPLFFEALTVFLETGRPLALAATFIVWLLQSLCTLYYGVFLAVLGPVYAVVFVLVRGPGRLRWTSPTGHLAAATLVIALGAWAFLRGVYLPYRETYGQFELAPDLEWLRNNAARPVHYLVTESRIGWAWSTRWWSYEHVLYPGALSVLALAAPPWSGAVPAALWAVGAVAFVLSLGPHTPVFLPLAEFVPFLTSLRNPLRWGFMVLWALALLAGLGATRLLRGRPRWVTVVGTVVLVGGTALDLWHAPLRSAPVPEPPPIYRRLAAQAEPGAVVPFPVYPDFGTTAIYTYWESFHWKPTVFITGSWAPPGPYWVRQVFEDDFPAPYTFWLAAQLNVRYLVFHGSLFRKLGLLDAWEHLQVALTTVPPTWVRARLYEGEDVLWVLDLDRIRSDFRLDPPDRLAWRSPPPTALRWPSDPAARQALTDGRRDTGWTVPYDEDWRVEVDFGRTVRLQALRVVKESKERFLFLEGSTDGQTWFPVHSVPWWVWAGWRLLPDGTDFPRPGWARENVVLLCADTRVRYVRVRSTPVAGRVRVSEVQAVWDAP